MSIKNTDATPLANDPKTLRRRAEELIQSEDGAESLLELDKTEIKKILHELRVHQIELKMQNEELQRSQQQLEQARNRFQVLFQHAPVGYLVLDEVGFIHQFNQTFADMLGCDLDDIRKKPFSRFLESDSQHEFLARYKALFNSREVRKLEINLRRKNGSVFRARLEAIKSSLLSDVDPDKPDKEQLWLTVSDITERIKAEEQIKKSLKEKETLLQEVHHRVKNNMQIISSLLNLQARKTEDARIIEALNKGRSRVYAMSAAHEILYNTDSFSEIDLDQYVKRLVQSLFQSFLVNPTQIKLDLRSERIRLDIKHATSIGLIINELVSNSLKYAFPNGRQGVITIQLEHVNTNEIRVVVADNGIGLPEEAAMKADDTLGLHLVKSLIADQLNGRFEIKDDAGAHYVFYFPLEDAP